MKAEELMIGDWVYYSSKKHIVQVVGISGIQYSFNQQDVILYGDCFKDFDGRGRWESHTTKSLSPIPLTTEILEKNGFKPYIPENHLETVYACQDVSKAIADELYALWPYRDGSFYLLLRVDGKDMVRMDVHYVHQLQHAMRLCGINKEIVL